MVIGDFLSRERDRGVRQFGDCTDIFNIEPATRDAGADVRLVLVIADHDLHWPSEHLPSKILDCHLRSDYRCLAAEIGIRTGLIVENADPNRCRRLRKGG
jgi:predicted nucleotidyltransferase